MIKTVIVDDEPKAIELIRSYLAHFADFEVVHTFRNGLKALEYLNKNRIDVIFLDINMPHLNGLSLSKMLSKETALVFTTAYSEHAVESYSIDALDYLLKPISLERFTKTIIKITQRFNQEKLSDKTRVPPNVIFLKSGTEMYQVKIDNINYLKKEGNYIYYHFENKKILTRETIAEALQHLTTDFIQIQKSYIVNFNRIESISHNFVTIGATKIPIGAQYKAQLSSKISG